MLKKGDFKIRLHGRRLNGDFALIHMKARRPGSKGTEWLLIKKQDDAVVKGYDIDQYDASVLTNEAWRRLAAIEKSTGVEKQPASVPGEVEGTVAGGGVGQSGEEDQACYHRERRARHIEETRNLRTPTKSVPSREKNNFPPALPLALGGSSSFWRCTQSPCPMRFIPCWRPRPRSHLTTRNGCMKSNGTAIAPLHSFEDNSVKLVSRTQNDLTGRFPELQDLPKFVQAKTAILDGEVVALDENGRASFSLMQQRTGIRKAGRQGPADRKYHRPLIMFSIFSLSDGYDLRRVALEERKRFLAEIVKADGLLRFSDHFDQGISLFEAARQKGLEGILAKRRASQYHEGRSRDWLKIKITQTVDCVIGGYTDPEGSREHFGAIVLGLYDQKKRLIHVGQAGHRIRPGQTAGPGKTIHTAATDKNPFYGPVEAKHVHWLKPELVAEIKFTEWTHETAEGGVKLRAPVFLSLRDDKKPEECTFAEHRATRWLVGP